MKTIEQTYGYDDVAIVPGEITLNPELVETQIKIGDIDLDIPVLASAMDSVCLLYTSPSPRDGLLSRMPSSA